MILTTRAISPLLLIVTIGLPATAQDTGKVNIPELGMSFVIPDGWLGQMSDGAYLMGSNTEPGLVMMTTHETSTLEQLKQEAQMGLNDGNGTNLQLTGEIEEIGEQAIGGVMQGMIEWQRAKAYVAGVINPLGQGVTVFVAADMASFGPKHRELAHDIIKSFQFFKAEIPPIVDQWKEKFTDARLTYLYSYSSNTPGGGGISSERQIDLCGAGFFQYYSSDLMSTGSGAVSASSYGQGQGQGKWEVIPAAGGGAILQLNFYSGEVYEYTLSYEDEKVHLDGERYFITYAASGGEYAPNCP